MSRPPPSGVLPSDAFVATLAVTPISALRLVDALASDKDLLHARFVVRGQTIGIFGTWEPRVQQRLDALRMQLRVQLPFMSVLAFDDVEASCERLAKQLSPMLTTNIAMAPVPRGGLIVAGLLAYALGLSRDQVRPALPGETVLIVDDTCISGVRMSEAVERSGADNTVVAVLAATTAAIDFLQRRFGDAICVVAERILTDNTEFLLGDDTDEWRSRWASRDAEGAAVLPEHLVFPWSEPDWTFWNSVTNDEDRGFALHSATPARTSSSITEILGEFPGTGDDVVWTTYGDSLVVAKEHPGETISFTLEGVKRSTFETICLSRSTADFTGSFASELRAQQLIR